MRSNNSASIVAHGCVGAGDGDVPPRDESLDFAEVVKTHWAALKRRALWLTKTDTDAADLVQETLVRAISATRRQNDPALVLRWLLAIMLNLFLDDCRYRAARRVVSNSARTLERLPSAEPEPPSLWRTASDERIGVCVAALPACLRETYRLYVCGWSYKDLARHFQVSTDTVGTRLHRLRKAIRRVLCSPGDRPEGAERKKRERCNQRERELIYPGYAVTPFVAPVVKSSEIAGARPISSNRPLHGAG
jgi:RNA polymerase sigma factor (sigma-70 family)